MVSGGKLFWPTLAVVGSIAHGSLGIVTDVLVARGKAGTRLYNSVVAAAFVCLLWTSLINTVTLCYYLRKGMVGHRRHVAWL